MEILSKKINKQQQPKPEFAVRISKIRYDKCSKRRIVRITFYEDSWRPLFEDPDAEKLYMYIGIEDGKLYFIPSECRMGWKFSKATKGLSVTHAVCCNIISDEIAELLGEFANRYYRELHYDEEQSAYYVYAEEGV